MDIYTVKARAYRSILNQKTYVLTNDNSFSKEIISL